MFSMHLSTFSDDRLEKFYEMSGRYYKCIFCARKFVSYDSVKTHFADRHRKGPIVKYSPITKFAKKSNPKECRLCDYNPTRVADLKKHYVSAHYDDIRVVFCNLCKFKCDSRKMMELHEGHDHFFGPRSK